MNRLDEYPVHGTCSKCHAPCRATDPSLSPNPKATIAWIHVDPTSHKPGMRGVRFIPDPIPALANA